MTEHLLCLDTNVVIKFLVPEEPEEEAEAAEQLMLRALVSGRLVAPAWAWAEVGSVLRKKMRLGQLMQDEAEDLWERFHKLPIEFLDTPALRARSWKLADDLSLPSLYDAAFLACTELAPAEDPAIREFWTADHDLLRRLGTKRPDFVHQLGQS